VCFEAWLKKKCNSWEAKDLKNVNLLAVCALASLCTPSQKGMQRSEALCPGNFIPLSNCPTKLRHAASALHSLTLCVFWFFSWKFETAALFVAKKYSDSHRVCAYASFTVHRKGCAIFRIKSRHYAAGRTRTHNLPPHT
jgi:hypothetical protein